VLSPDPELLTRAARFRNHGLVRDPAEQRFPDEGPWHQEVHALGLNYRLPDVLCALGSSQLRRLPAFVARRAELSARYDAALADVPEVRTPHRSADADVAWHLYPARVPEQDRRRLFEHLRAHGIGVQVNYIPAHWHPVFADLGHRRGECPVAERWYREEISLPLYVGLSDDDVDRVCDLVRGFFAA
jgi:dTDP-4-amino-4,6-dideoxygalactose transaminase